MFHGTSSVFKDSILSNGLLANPPKKTWNEGFYRSLDGVYFSCSLEQSLFFAYKSVSIHGGNPIVVIAEIDNQDALPDEDNISRLIKWSLDLCPTYQFDLFQNNFFKLMEEIEGIFISNELKQDLKQILHPVLNLEIKRKQHNSNEIVKYYDLISKKLKSFALTCKKPIHNKSFRVIDNVKVENDKNKIVAMIEVLPNKKIKTIYGSANLPQTLFFQLRKAFGNFEMS